MPSCFYPEPMSDDDSEIAEEMYSWSFQIRANDSDLLSPESTQWMNLTLLNFRLKLKDSESSPTSVYALPSFVLLGRADICPCS